MAFLCPRYPFPESLRGLNSILLLLPSCYLGPSLTALAWLLLATPKANSFSNQAGSHALSFHLTSPHLRPSMLEHPLRLWVGAGQTGDMHTQAVLSMVKAVVHELGRVFQPSPGSQSARLLTSSVT